MRTPLLPRTAGVGIKQEIRWEWLDYTAKLHLIKMEKTAIRATLIEHLSTRSATRDDITRGKEAVGSLVGNLMNVWVTPRPHLVAYRDDLLHELSNSHRNAIAIHWAMIGATYPFWYAVARVVGRLLYLQREITINQIEARMVNFLGESETVTRAVRRVVRSFIAWGFLKDTERKGIYALGSVVAIQDQHLAALLFEGALYTVDSKRFQIDRLREERAFFPFDLPLMSGRTSTTPRVELLTMPQHDILMLIPQRIRA